MSRTTARRASSAPSSGTGLQFLVLGGGEFGIEPCVQLSSMSDVAMVRSSQRTAVARLCALPVSGTSSPRLNLMTF
jgi:hypothetical protein